jgi:predicted amidohydrolase YtcJ
MALIFAATTAVVLANAHVLTMDRAHPTATTIGISDGKIAYVGDDLAAARKAAGTQTVIDIAGKTLIPGFDDAHVHFGLSLTLGSERGVDLPELSKRAFVESLKRASAQHPPVPEDPWLFVKTRKLPDGISRARDLDFVDRPCFVVTARGGLLNRAGMTAGKFTDEEAPNGFVRGRALAAALDRLVQLLPYKRLREGALRFLDELAKNGITSAQLISEELPELFDGLRKDGKLTARLRMVPLGYRLETQFYEPKWVSPDPDWLRVDGVKYFHDDGARITRFELQEIFDRVIATGRRVVVHVLSRHALETLLDGLEAQAKATGRADAIKKFRVDHADELDAADAARLAKDGIVICSNPSMLPEWKTDHAFPMHTLLQAGVRTCIGTDWVGAHYPPRPLSPMNSIQLAVGRGGFGTTERIGAGDALEAYTLGSATAEGLDAQKGSLAVGKLADLAVLSDDPETIAVDKLNAVRVLLTMVGGRIVWSSGDLQLPPAHRPPPPTIGPATKQPPTIGPPKK